MCLPLTDALSPSPESAACSRSFERASEAPRGFQAPRLLAVLAITLVGRLAWAGDCTPPRAPARFGDALTLEYEDDVPYAVIDAAIGYWRSCPGYGSDFPVFRIRGEGLRSVRVRRAEPSEVRFLCATFHGDTIALHTAALDDFGKSVPCGSLPQNLAHELGHVLGLGDLQNRGSCRTEIMGFVTPTSAYRRRVTTQECIAAGSRWLTALEKDQARQLGYFDGEVYTIPLEDIDRLVNGRE
jgi:hypothetical protein